MTAVGLITDRAERALALEANKLLGGDAVLRGDAPMAGSVLQVNEAPVMPPVVPASPDAWSRPAPPPPLINPAAGESNYYGGTTITKP